MLIRIQYRKTKEGRFLSHLDGTHSWERSIRRAGLPLAYSQGFNPHPKIAFASALAVGTTSDSEYMDMELSEEMSESEVLHALQRSMAPAFEVIRLKRMEGKQDALMSLVNCAEYHIRLEFAGPVSETEIKQAIGEAFQQEVVEVLRFKKNSKEKKAVNIRPGLRRISGSAEGLFGYLDVEVQTGNDFNVKPEEVVYGLMACGLPPVQSVLQVHRTGLWILQPNGKKITPLEL